MSEMFYFFVFTLKPDKRSLEFFLYSIHGKQKLSKIYQSQASEVLPCRMLYRFARTVVNEHGLGGLDQDMYCLIVLEARSPKPRCWQCWFLLGAVRENVAYASLLASGGLLAISGLWMCHSNLCLCLHMAVLPVCLTTSSSVHVCSCGQISPFHKDTGHIKIRAHPNDLTLICLLL